MRVLKSLQPCSRCLVFCGLYSLLLGSHRSQRLVWGQLPALSPGAMMLRMLSREPPPVHLSGEMFYFLSPFPLTSHMTPLHPSKRYLCPRVQRLLSCKRLFLEENHGDTGAEKETGEHGSPCLSPAGPAWKGDSAWSPHA